MPQNHFESTLNWLVKDREMVALSTEPQANLAVAAQLAHASYAGRRDDNGQVIPRHKITMASALDEATCQRVKLGFMDHRSFRREDYESDPNTLVVERAGRDLYLVEPH